MLKPIVITPNPVLAQPTQTVGKIDAKITTILQEMKEALLAACDPKGVGLAAPQIGYSLQIFAIKPKKDSRVRFFINPKIIAQSQEQVKVPKQNTPLEGCLSIPNTWGIVKRKKWVTLAYLDAKGQQKTRTFKDFPAVIIQHEMDHLFGTLFTTRVLEQNGKLYEIIKDKEGKESLKELPL